MGCFGNICATQASKQPIKRYNVLVQEAFPKDSPGVYEPLSTLVTKKIEKVHDYAAENLQNAPKVSRRIDRRIVGELKAQKLGYVKVGVHAYMYLLAKGRTEDCSLYTKELISNEDSVIPRLMKFPLAAKSAEPIWTLALELLVHFIRVQRDGDFFQKIEALIPGVFDFLDSQKNSSLESTASGLRVLREFVSLVQRLSYPSTHLHRISSTALDKLKMPAPTSAVRALDVHFVNRLELAGDYTSVNISALAESIFLQLGRLCSDTVVANKVIGNLLGDISKGKAWKGNPQADAALVALRHSLGPLHLQDQIFLGMIKHLEAPELDSMNQAQFLQVASQEANDLEAASTIPALVSSLALLPPVLSQAARGSKRAGSSLEEHAFTCLRNIVRRTDAPGPVLDALDGVLKQRDTSNAESIYTLKCVACVTQQLSIPAKQARRGASKLKVERMPNSLFQELVLLMGPPSTDPHDKQPLDPIVSASLPTVEQQALTDTIMLSLLPVIRQPLKAGQAQQLQRSLYIQLHPRRPHSTEQIAVAGNLMAAVVPYTPTEFLYNTGRVLVSTMKEVTDTAQSRDGGGPASQSVQLIQVCEHGLRSLNVAAQCSQPNLLTLDFSGSGIVLKDGNFVPQPPCSESKCRALFDQPSTSETLQTYYSRSAHRLSQSPVLYSPSGSIKTADFMRIDPAMLLTPTNSDPSHLMLATNEDIQLAVCNMEHADSPFSVTRSGHSANAPSVMMTSIDIVRHEVAEPRKLNPHSPLRGSSPDGSTNAMPLAAALALLDTMSTKNTPVKVTPRQIPRPPVAYQQPTTPPPLTPPAYMLTMDSKEPSAEIATHPEVIELSKPPRTDPPRRVQPVQGNEGSLRLAACSSGMSTSPHLTLNDTPSSANPTGPALLVNLAAAANGMKVDNSNKLLSSQGFGSKTWVLPAGEQSTLDSLELRKSSSLADSADTPVSGAAFPERVPEEVSNVSRGSVNGKSCATDGPMTWKRSTRRSIHINDSAFPGEGTTGGGGDEMETADLVWPARIPSIGPGDTGAEMELPMKGDLGMSHKLSVNTGTEMFEAHEAFEGVSDDGSFADARSTLPSRQDSFASLGGEAA